MYNLSQCLDSYGASSTMKHDGPMCNRSFVRVTLNHSTKFSHVCWFTITWIIGTFVWWKSNTINVKYVVLHIVGAKCDIHKNKPIVIKLEHTLKLHRCLDVYGERDLNPIHLICILEIKNIIRMNTNPWLNGKRQFLCKHQLSLLWFQSK